MQCPQNVIRGKIQGEITRLRQNMIRDKQSSVIQTERQTEYITLVITTEILVNYK